MSDGGTSRSAARAILRFARCELDPAARDLRVDGAPVPIQPRVLDLLLHLIEHRDRAVSKDELYEKVWGGTLVAETALTQAVKELRQAIGDDGSRQALVRTVRRFGYRFVAELAATATPTPTPSRPAYVGREEVLAAVDAGIEAAAAGTGGALLLAGEPGIGKSRTQTEVAERARRRGLLVLEGRGALDDGAPHYWPWQQVLEAAVARSSMRTDGRRHLAIIAEVMPELRIDVAITAPGREPWRRAADQERFRFFEAVRSLLVDLSPVVVLLDDLHAADVPSLRLLQYVLRNAAGGPYVVGAYRDATLIRDATRREILGTLSRIPGTRATILDGFGTREIAAYVEGRRGEPVSAELLRVLEEQTRGNPFFLEQILLLWSRHDPGDFAVGAVPAGVDAAIRQHLEILDPRALDALRVAAVVGADFDPRLLVELPEGPVSREPFDEALAARVLVQSPEGDGRLRFAHALIRDTLGQSLTAPRKLAIHRGLVDVLRPRGEARLAQIAHHAYEAARLGGDALDAAAWAEAAAERCNRQHAFEEEERHLERGLAALDLSTEGDEDRRLRLMLRLAICLVKQGNQSGGLALCARAAERAVELGRPELLARAAIAYEETGFALAERYLFDPVAIRHLEAALAAQDDESAALRVRTGARLARRLLYAGRHDDAVALARDSTDRCARGVDARTEACALESLAFVSWRPEQLPVRLAAARQMLDAALRDDELETVLDAQGLLVMVLLEGGDVEGLEPLMADMDRLLRTERWISPWRRWMFRLSQGTLAQLKGRFDDAEKILRELTELAPELERADATVALAAQRLQLRWWQGRGLEEIALFDWLAQERYPRVILAASGYALLGRLAESRKCYDRALGHGLDAAESDVRSPQALAGLATACIALRDAETAVELYERLLPWREHNAVMRPAATFSGSMERSLAGLADVRGDVVAARVHWERSLAAHTRAGALPWAARDQVGLAELLVRHDPAGERERITQLASMAAHSAKSLDCPLLVDEVARLEALRRAVS